MKKIFGAALILIALSGSAGCGKVLSSLAKGAAHDADSVASAAAKSVPYEESQTAGSAAAHNTDEALYGPAAAEDVTNATPTQDFMLDAAKKFGEEIRDSAIEEGVTSALQGDDDRE